MRIDAAVLHGNRRDFVVEPVELAEPGPHEVRVRLVATGMCHTDILVMEEIPLPWPAVLGHEGAGVVEAVGEAVEHIAIGDHVVLCQPSCGQCLSCRRGNPSYCLHFIELGLSAGLRADGTCSHRQCESRVFGQFLGQSSFASHAVVTERAVVPIAHDIPLEIACPLGCGIQTGAGAVFNTLRPVRGDSLAVFGAGAVGLSALMAAKIAGCFPVIAIDKVPARLDLARELGASHVINAATQDVVAAVRTITGNGVGGAIEATGHPAVTTDAVAALAHNGTAVLVSAVGRGTAISFDPADLQTRGLTVKASLLCGEGTSSQLFIPQLIRWWQAGMFPFDRMIQYYAFADINRARRDSGDGRTIKPVLRFEPPPHAATPKVFDQEP